MNDQQEKAFAVQGKLIDIQQEINNNVDETLALDKAKIEEQDKKIIKLQAKVDELEKDASYLWHNLDDGSYLDWEYWYDKGVEDGNRELRRQQREALKAKAQAEAEGDEE